MDATSPIGQLMQMAIATGQLRPNRNGSALRHTGDLHTYHKTTHGRIVRERRGVKEVFDPARQAFTRVRRLRAGEAIETQQRFTVEDLVPGVSEHLRQQPMADLYAHIIPGAQPEPPPPRPGTPVTPPVPSARAPFRPQATAPDFLGNQATQDMQAVRDDIRRFESQRFRADDGQSGGPST